MDFIIKHPNMDLQNRSVGIRTQNPNIATSKTTVKSSEIDHQSALVCLKQIYTTAKIVVRQVIKNRCLSHFNRLRNHENTIVISITDFSKTRRILKKKQQIDLL